MSVTPYFLEIILNPGEWCPILVRNGLSNGDPNSAISLYTLNANTTGMIFK